MDSTICRFCRRKFYSSSNRHRHEAYFHKMPSKHDEMNDESFDSKQPDTKSDMEENETPTDSVDEEQTDDQSEQKEQEEEQDYWEMLIEETCREMNIKKEIRNPKDLLVEPILGEFLEELCQQLESRMKFAQYMEDHDKVYQEIQTTAERFREKDLDEDEAFEKAWNKRKYLLKWLLRDNLNIIKDVLNESDDGENSEIEDNNEGQMVNGKFM